MLALNFISLEHAYTLFSTTLVKLFEFVVTFFTFPVEYNLSHCAQQDTSN